MAEERIVGTRYTFVVDDQGVTRVVNAASVTKAALVDISKANADAAKSALDLGSTAPSALEKARQSANDAADANRALRDEYIAAADAAEKLNEAQSKSGGISSGDLRTAGRALDQLGLSGVGRPLQQIGDIGILSQDLDKFNTVLATAVPALDGLTVGVGGLEVAVSPLVAVLGPLALTIGVVVGAIKLYNDALEAQDKIATKLVKGAVGELDAYYEAKKNDTTETATEKVDKAKRDKKGADDELAQIQGQIESGRRQAVQQAGANITINKDGRAVIVQPNGVEQETDSGQAKLDEFNNSEAGKLLIQRAKELGDASEKAQNTIVGVGRALDDGSLKANDAAAAQKKYNDELTEAAKAADAAAKTQVNDAVARDKLIRTGTTKQVDDQIADIEARKAAINAANGKAGLSVDQIVQFAQELDALDTKEQDLTTNVRPLVAAREAEAEAAKKTATAVKELAGEIEKSKQLTSDYQLAVGDITQKGLQERADLEKQYADKRIELAIKAKDAAIDALNKLTEKQQDLATSLGNDLSKENRATADKQLQEQIQFNRQEVADATDHVRRLQDIRRSAQASEQTDLLNRNFTNLLTRRIDVNRQITDENTRYQRQQQDRITAAQNTRDDDIRQAAITRRERLISYQQALTDAQTVYQREGQQRQLAQQRQLQADQRAEVVAEQQLATKISRELSLRQQGYSRELQLLSAQEAARAQIIASAAAKALTPYANSAINGLSNLVSGFLSGGSTTHATQNNNFYGVDTNSVLNLVNGTFTKLVRQVIG